MLEEFRRDVDSVIFGTASFWMGVDVPGEALSNVIITKLPFAVPTQPLTQARTEKLDREGRSGFNDYLLPEAVLRLKQGVGRLIRNSTDKGIIVILDSRVVTKRYGRMFIDSIPKCPRIDH
jgi:ATP-dependent DNA helicase DinG